MELDRERFEKLCELRSEVLEYCRYHLSALALFHPLDDIKQLKDRKIKISAFSKLFPNGKDIEEIKLGKVSITSTVTCLKSLLLCQQFQPSLNVDYSEFINRLNQNESNLSTTGLSNYNPYTVGLLLPILKRIDITNLNQSLIDKCVKAAQKSIKNGKVSIQNFAPSSYLTYWILRGLETWDIDINSVAKKVIVWARNELDRQMNLFQCKIDDESDAFQLGYVLLILFKYDRSNLKDQILQEALKLIFNTQLDRGVWEKKDPLFVYKKSGNAYCFSFELLTTLFFVLKDNNSFLEPFDENFLYAFGWAKRNKNLVNNIPVWRSGHRCDDKRSESWATSEVYLFLQYYLIFLSERIQDIALLFFKGKKNITSDRSVYLDLLKPKIALSSGDILLDRFLIENIITPLEIQDGSGFTLIRNIAPRRKIRSGILFGPSGTGKTTYVKSIAKYLGWPLIILNPSDFAKEGFQSIPSTTSRIFDILVELEDTVIFFDEMEELIKERHSIDSINFEQKFLTTTLLPKLQSLYDSAKCIFFIATNHYSGIDKAAKRAGRFDFAIQILPPCFEEKIALLEKKWESYRGPGLLEDVKKLLKENEEKIQWASISEINMLIDNIISRTEEAANILSNFTPQIMNDTEYEAYKKGNEDNNINSVLEAVL